MMQPVISLPILPEPPQKFNRHPGGVQPPGKPPGGKPRGWEPWSAVDAPGLYMHVPFCVHKCHYCDFYSIVEKPGKDGDRQEAFTAALLGELEARVADAPRRPRTIFVGGGTPTLLRAKLWEKLLAGMARLGVLDQVQEFTVEANPETVTPDLMATLAAGGVNRVSMGAQSFDPRLLKALERRHDPASVPRAVEAAREAGILRLNLDLIFAIPGQDRARFDRDLDAALSLGVTHLSCYALTYEPGTAMTVKLEQGRVTAADEVRERELYEHAMARLAGEGFDHYEVSAWAKPGQRCAHNLLYWSNDSWLGVGPSAASHLAGRRWRNQPHLGRYLAAAPTPPTVDHEHRGRADRIGEALMMGLRLREGVSTSWLDANVEPGSPRSRAIQRMSEGGWLQRAEARLRLTDKGLMVADAVVGELL